MINRVGIEKDFNDFLKEQGAYDKFYESKAKSDSTSIAKTKENVVRRLQSSSAKAVIDSFNWRVDHSFFSELDIKWRNWFKVRWNS